MASTSNGKPIRPRAFPIEVFERAIPRRWLANSVIATHLANGVNLLFPAGERFFVRSVRHYRKAIEADPELAAAVKGFAAQEGHHARAHEAFFDVMERQGYEIRKFLKVYEFVGYKVLEPIFPPSYRLATTAAAEHFTAVLAENFLVERDDKDMDRTMYDLITWHACEEIEHRAVAYEVLQRVDPRYHVRIAGLAIATATLAGFWIAATLYLLSQEKGVVETVRREAGPVSEHQPFGERVFGRGIRAYLKRDFHPSNSHHLDELVARSAGELEMLAAT